MVDSKLPFEALDAASNADSPALFMALTFAPFSMSNSTIFKNPINRAENEFSWKISILREFWVQLLLRFVVFDRFFCCQFYSITISILQSNKWFFYLPLSAELINAVSPLLETMLTSAPF